MDELIRLIEFEITQGDRDLAVGAAKDMVSHVSDPYAVFFLIIDILSIYSYCFTWLLESFIKINKFYFKMLL
jgi:hypothetical protein